jgi:hypothetical protein
MVSIINLRGKMGKMKFLPFVPGQPEKAALYIPPHITIGALVMPTSYTFPTDFGTATTLPARQSHLSHTPFPLPLKTQNDGTKSAILSVH